MDGLYVLKLEVEKKAGAVSRYNIEHNIPSREEAEYKEALERFIAVGRQILGDETLTAHQIKEKVELYVVNDAKTLLVGTGEDIYQTIMSGGHVGNRALEELEKVLNMADSVGESFYSNAAYEGEREFLARFTPEEIAAFKDMQNYIRSLPLSDMPRV